MKSRKKKKFSYLAYHHHHISKYLSRLSLLLLLCFICNQLLLSSSSLIVTSSALALGATQHLTRLPSPSTLLNNHNNVSTNNNDNNNSNNSETTTVYIANEPFSSSSVVLLPKPSNKLNSEKWTHLPSSNVSPIVLPLNHHKASSPVSSRQQGQSVITSSNNNNSSNTLLNIYRNNNNINSPTRSLAFTQQVQHRSDFKKKICIGTTNRLSLGYNNDDHYQSIRDRYTNCTYVDGNLEITWLENEVDLSFLSSIREVTGYVLIAYVNVEKIHMPNLQIIRGRELFTMTTSDDKYALFITHCNMRIIELPGLRDILNGNVGIHKSPNMCHIKKIQWEEILSGPEAKVFYFYNNTVPPENCSCDDCDHGCWSETPGMCQQILRKNCNPQCQRSGCYGPKIGECCHSFCAGGCTGPSQRDCLACKNFNDDGVCRQECPSMMRYNPSSYSWEANPEGKYAYGANCVKDCPDHLLRDNGACVKTCPPHKRNEGGECVLCVGPCPKKCLGIDKVNSGNIESFRGCTQIEGSLTILDTSFSGYNEVYPDFTIGTRHPPLHPSELEVFSTLREITGFLNIQASHKDFKNLSCFRNLERIEGRQTTDIFTTLNIVKTSLVSLNLRSLKQIRSGKVAIVENPDLCFVDTLKWKQIITQVSDTSKDVKIQSNAESSKCKKEGLVCHEQCSQDGCWGPRSDECLTCKNFKFEGRCVKECPTYPISSYNAGNNTCQKCHEECANGCKGPNSSDCRECKNVRDGPYCVQECPVSKYNSSGYCLTCHESCSGGCTGPLNKTGRLGCNSCQKAIINSSDPSIIDYCIKVEDQCPVGYYLEHNETRPICRKCHPMCKTCQAMGIHASVCECSAFEVGDYCESKCPGDFYADGKKCKKCSPSCNGCEGPTEWNCLTCRHFKVNDSSSGNFPSFYCTENCPADKPYKIIQNTDFYCSDIDKSPSESDTLVGASQVTAMSLIIIIVSLLLFFVYKCQRVKSEENTAKLTMRMSGFDDDEPLQPSNIEPNLAKLRIIQECELREGKQLGQGSGGIVYQGQWIESENGETLGKNKSIKRLVAIKVLKDEAQPNKNKQFLEEAKLMASVNHPNLVKLLAVCMTSRLMLITELMPLGCLLQYVRTLKDRIRPINLLNWCSQIAKGMAYLEERNIVHRDLALRNVLVKAPNRVLITDFGLAKLLDDNKGEYQAEGGKLPVRWLAPECLQRKIFTHKSDVWAFSVTVWELLTYGEDPYHDLHATAVPEHVLSGRRLNQPENASIDVFCTMTKCWMVHPDDRPTFQELVKEFSIYRRDPCRYLVPRNSLKDSGNYPQLCDSIDMSMEEPFFDLPYPTTPFDNMNSVNSPRKLINSEVQNFSFSVNDINNYKKNASYSNYPNAQDFDTLPYHEGKRYLSGYDFNNNHNFSIPRTPTKTTPPIDDLNLPVDEHDYILPSNNNTSSNNNIMNIISMNINGINNPEYHLKYDDTYYQPNHIQYTRQSTGDASSSDGHSSDSGSYTKSKSKPDETAV